MGKQKTEPGIEPGTRIEPGSKSPPRNPDRNPPPRNPTRIGIRFRSEVVGSDRPDRIEMTPALLASSIGRLDGGAVDVVGRITPSRCIGDVFFEIDPDRRYMIFVSPFPTPRRRLRRRPLGRFVPQGWGLELRYMKMSDRRAGIRGERAMPLR